jgi:hypothetical protein
LRTMTGDRIAMIEMAVLSGIEIDLAGTIQAGSNAAVRGNRFDDSEVAIGNAKRLVRSGI